MGMSVKSHDVGLLRPGGSTPTETGLGRYRG